MDALAGLGVVNVETWEAAGVNITRVYSNVNTSKTKDLVSLFFILNFVLIK